MSITKNVLLNWYSSMKKKLRKIRTIFDIENWLWKLRGWVILHFLTPPHSPNSENSIISFEYVDSEAKIFLMLYPSLENSTTRIGLSGTAKVPRCLSLVIMFLIAVLICFLLFFRATIASWCHSSTFSCSQLLETTWRPFAETADDLPGLPALPQAAARRSRRSDLIVIWRDFCHDCVLDVLNNQENLFGGCGLMQT